MKIVFLIEYFAPDIGGLERSTERLAASLVKLGHEVSIVTNLLPQTPRKETTRGFTIYRRASDLQPFSDCVELVPLYDAADLLCVFGVGHDPEGRWMQTALRSKAQVKALKPGTEGDLRKFKAREFLQRFNVIFCQNESLCEECIEVGIPASRAVLTSNGINLTDWHSGLIERAKALTLLSIPNNRSIVLGLGRFVERKRFPLLAQAFSIVHDIQPSAYLLLHGSDFGQHDGEEDVLRHLVSPFVATGCAQFVSPETLPQISFSASDVFVTLGTREGAPNVILESLASGVPCVMNDISGHRRYISGLDCCHLIAEHDLSPQKLAETILLSLDRCRDQQVSVCCQKQAELFNVDRVAQLYVKTQRECAGQRSFMLE